MATDPEETEKPTEIESETEPKPINSVNAKKTNEKPSVLPLVLLTGIVVAIALGVILGSRGNAHDPQSQSNSVIIRSLETQPATATPEVEFEPEIERQIVEAINYRRNIESLPEMVIYRDFVLYARKSLKDSSVSKKPDITGISNYCNKQCTFDLQTNLSVTIQEVNVSKDDVVEESLDMLTSYILSREIIFQCSKSVIGIGAREITRYKYYIVLLAFKPSNC